MGKHDKFNSKKVPAYKRELKELDVRDGKKERFLVLSFKDFDVNQGQHFKDWENEGLLALAVEKLRAVCQLTVGQATAQQIIKPYTKVVFPPESDFKHPKHVHPSVTWCSMHVQGKECVIGYLDDNIFHIVFLDKNHHFWITEKK